MIFNEQPIWYRHYIAETLRRYPQLTEEDIIHHSPKYIETVVLKKKNLMNREDLIILSDLVQASARRLHSEYRRRNPGFTDELLVWYMPSVFVLALKTHYYREMGIQPPQKPQLMGIEIREGYEPRVVLTSTNEWAFTRPEYTLRGEDLVTENKAVN